MKRHAPDGRIVRNPMNDWSDCTVHAVMNVLGVSYECAHTICANAGRKYGKGAYSVKVIAEINNRFGAEHMIVVPNSEEWYRYSLSQFVGRYPVGRFYVNIHRHAFSVINGEVVDTTTQIRTPGSLVNGAWVLKVSWIGNRQDVLNMEIPDF